MERQPTTSYPNLPWFLWGTTTPEPNEFHFEIEQLTQEEILKRVQEHVSKIQNYLFLFLEVFFPFAVVLAFSFRTFLFLFSIFLLSMKNT